ncbi:CLASP N terminal [Rhizoctonia solani]|uniref:CLASP N terminal n=1 Tax=Rhizoctonia solani TaxID=456999 RepID=A0A8H7IG97_9AGAM|nr:CLASP N terminal [Rhizoctonia solani]
MPPSVPDKIPCHSAKDLRYALDPLRPLQEQLETEENWDKISRAIQTIAALTRGGAAELDAEYIKEIRGFSTLILNSMNSERTRLANIAVDLFTVILPHSAANSSHLSSSSLAQRPLRVMVNDKSAPLRVLVAGAVLLCLTSWDWSIPTFAAKAGDVEIVIRTFGTDSNVDVRKITRQIFDQYRQEFPDRVDSSFLEPLTPVIKRYLDIKAKSSQDKAGPAPRKQAPVPAPQFKAVVSAPAPVPAPIPSAQEVPVQIVEEQPRPKMTRVGVGRPGPSRAPVVDSHTQAPSAPTHSRIVSGPERIMTQVTRDHTQDVHATAGPMRTTVAQSSSSAPVVRSVSSSGPSRMRVEQPVAAYPSSAFDIQPSSSAQPPAESGRRFRPVRAPMDPSQMPQRVAVPPPVPKPTVESKKPSGPTRVNLGAGVRNVSGPTVAPPARVASVTVKTDHPLGTNLTAPSLSPNTDEPQTKASSSAPAPTSSSIQVSIPGEPNPSLPSPASAPVPSSAPASRPASTIPADSRPPSVASNRSKAPTTTSTSTESHLSSVKNATTATAPAKPTLTTSKSAPITTKVSALIKRGNPYAPHHSSQKSAASGGVGAGTASQMARQREAIAAREKREAEEATKKSKKEAREGKKPASTDGATSTRSRPASSQAGTSRNPPAAPRKRTVSTRAKPPGGPPKVDLKTIEPEMIAAVCAPLPGSPTPLAIRETPLPPSPVENAHSPNHVDAEVMVLDDGVEGDVEMQQVDQEPSNEEPNSIETEGTTSTKQEIVVPAPEPEPERVVIEISDDSSEVDMDEPHHEDELAAHTGAEATEQAVQTPPSRTTPISIIDQTPVPAGTTPPMPLPDLLFILNLHS